MLQIVLFIVHKKVNHVWRHFERYMLPDVKEIEEQSNNRQKVEEDILLTNTFWQINFPLYNSSKDNSGKVVKFVDRTRGSGIKHQKSTFTGCSLMNINRKSPKYFLIQEVFRLFIHVWFFTYTAIDIELEIVRRYPLQSVQY